jgi:hypothetical protein
VEAKNMSFAAAIQNTHAEALYKFSMASIEYKKACSVYTAIRLAADALGAEDEAIVRHHRAKVVYKEACRKYALARAEYVSTIRAAAVKAPSLTNEDLFNITVETNSRALTEEIRKEAVLATISDKDNEAVLEGVRLHLTNKGREIPAEYQKPEESKDVDAESGKILFDPEFDKFD